MIERHCGKRLVAEIRLRFEDLLGGGWGIFEEHFEIFPTAILQAGQDKVRPLHVGEKGLHAEKEGGVRKRRILLELLMNHHVHQGRNGTQLPQVQPPGHLLQHGGRGLSLHDGLACVRSVVIAARPVQITLQVPVLILQGVGEFVGEHHGLGVGGNPVRNEHGLALGVVKARRPVRCKS